MTGALEVVWSSSRTATLEFFESVPENLVSIMKILRMETFALCQNWVGYRDWYREKKHFVTSGLDTTRSVWPSEILDTALSNGRN